MDADGKVLGDQSPVIGKFLIANTLYTFALSFIANSTPALPSLPRSSSVTLSRFPIRY